MIARLVAFAGVLKNTFHAPGMAAWLLLTFPLYWLWVSLGLIIDRVFLTPRDDAATSKTIVLAGPPRSGTTFLHRYLDEHTTARGTQLWEALVPALCWQKLLRPTVRWAARRDWPDIDLGAAHVAGLTLPETDDLQIFARYIDSFFYYVYGLSWRETDSPDYLGAPRRPPGVAARDLSWLRLAACRNRANGRTDTALLKLFSAGFALAETRTALPGSRIIYVSRAPHETLPSSLSMVSRVLGLRGLYVRATPDARQRHVERIVSASLALQKAAIADIRQLPANTILVIRYEDLITDFSATMNRILVFTGEPPDETLEKEIMARDREQRSYTSAHKYDLNEFGLSERHIREQFRDVYAFFNH